MRRFIFLSIGLMLYPLAATLAEETEFSFAIPRAKGTVSLAFYNTSGELVRTVADDSPMSAFRIGLNGLSGKWDNRDDNGERVSPGTYFGKGIIISDVEVEGVAYHLNDWAGESHLPLVRDLSQIGAQADGSLILLARGDGGYFLLEIRPDGTTQQLAMPGLPIALDFYRPSTNGRSALLAVTGETLWLVESISPALSRVTRWSRNSGQIFQFFWPGSIQTLASTSERLALTGSGWLCLLSLKSDSSREALELISLPFRAQSLAFLGERLVLLPEADRKLHWLIENKILPFPGLEELRGRALSTGEEDSFWAVAQLDRDAPFLGQFNETGELLRKMQLESTETRRFAIAISSTPLRIYLLEESEGEERLTGLEFRRRVEPGDAQAQAVSEWEFILEKSLRLTPYFSLNKDRVEPSETPVDLPNEVIVTSRLNPLTNKTSKIPLVLRNGPDGVDLQTESGLQIIQITDRPAESLALVPGGENGMAKVFLGFPGVVEEYALRGLENLLPFDVGEVVVSP